MATDQSRAAHLYEHQEAYMQSMENQIKVNDKMVEQIVLERAKM